MSSKYGIVFLVLAAFIAFGTALAHISCIFFGAECYSAQMAPQFIVDSALNGTIVAPLGALIASSIFAILGCYALSGAKVIGKLPLLSFGIYAITVVCIIRGLLPWQLWIRHPDKVSNAILIVGLVWLITGLLFGLGYRAMGKSKR